MTETLDKQLAQWPHCAEFVDANGKEWFLSPILKTLCDSNERPTEVFIRDHMFKFVSIPGLRPKPRKMKKELSGYICKSDIYAPFGIARCFYLEECPGSIPAKITYELDEE